MKNGQGSKRNILSTMSGLKAALCAAGVITATSALPAPENLGGGLREMAEQHERGNAAQPAPKGATRPADMGKLIRRDDRGRVLVSVHLNGQRNLDNVAADLAKLGASVTGKTALEANGAVSAYIPVERAADIARLAGVRSVMLTHKPQLRVGKTTSEGAAVLHTDVLNLHGLTGKGITIGVLSDSYDLSPDPTIRAADDIASGDLPGKANPFGRTTPIVVLQEDLTPPFTDEGRGILQILHDLAPDAKLCFASAFNGIASFASNIVALADPVQGCGANVIVDDVGYGEEPVFSDGAVARAVDLVASEGVAYFSSASNANQTTYDADFNPVSNERARAGLPGSNLKLDQVPVALTAGGFHNFVPSGPPQIAQPVAVAADDPFILQWNDPFNAGAVTANYSFLVFDAGGNFLDAQTVQGGQDDTFATDMPIQEIVLPGPAGNDPPPTYQLVIAKTRHDAAPARRLHYIDFFANSTVLAFTQPFAPSTDGHPSAAGAMSVAAEYWGDTKSIEYFSSLGPTAIYFDSANRRLHHPEVRKKPDMAAVDGVHTTFFPPGGEVDNSGFPSFFGTSASAPHAAGVGALLIELAGGPGHLSPPTLRHILQQSAHSHDKEPGFIEASGDTLGLNVAFTGRGYISRDPTKFTLSFDDQRHQGRALTRLVLDLAPAGLIVRDSFQVGDFGSLKPADVKLVSKLPGSTLRIDFPTKKFTSGETIKFGFRFGEASIGLLGRNVDLLAGTTLTATFSDGSVATTTLANKRTKKYEIDVGRGLIDAEGAAALLSPVFDASSVRQRSQVIEDDTDD